MTFIDHLEALRWHLVRMSVALLIGTILCFIFIKTIFTEVLLAPTRSTFAPYKILCGLGEKLNMTNFCMQDTALDFQSITPAAQFMMSITSALTFSFVLVFPYIIYELWKFIKPALTPKETKLSRGAIFWISLLFILGVLFGYYVISPFSLNFFANYQLSEQFVNNWTIDSYVSMMQSLMLGAGLIFELPVLVYFLSKTGLLTPRIMREYRKYSLVVVLILSAIITPPDVISQIVVCLPVMLLYEISIGISARVEKQLLAEEKKWVDQYKA